MSNFYLVSDEHECKDCGVSTPHVSEEGYLQCEACEHIERCPNQCSQGLYWKHAVRIDCTDCPAYAQFQGGEEDAA
jgi:hypothetical protein